MCSDACNQNTIQCMVLLCIDESIHVLHCLVHVSAALLIYSACFGAVCLKRACIQTVLAQARICKWKPLRDMQGSHCSLSAICPACLCVVCFGLASNTMPVSSLNLTQSNTFDHSLCCPSCLCMYCVSACFTTPFLYNSSFSCLLRSRYEFLASIP